MDWFKKVTGFTIGTALLVLVTLALLIGGCQTTSDDTTTPQLAGSWEGTLGVKDVRAIFAPDHTFHMAFLDGSGGATGKVNTILEDVGRGEVTVREAFDSINGDIVFKLTTMSISGRLNNLELKLHTTPDARHPAQIEDVAGRWSLASAGVISDLWVDQDGNLSGSDAVRCDYSGTLQLLSPDWNIFRLDLLVSNKVNESCPARGSYVGYTMVAGTGIDKTILLSAAEDGGSAYLAGAWYATNNRAPVVEVQPLPPSVAVVSGRTKVKLDGTESSDENHDPLTYQWSVVPDSAGVVIQDPLSALTTFSANQRGSYTFTLTVDDKINPTTQTVAVNVVIAPERYTDMVNGTVRSNETNNTNGVPLIWLKDTRCSALINNDPVGISLLEADVNVRGLAAGMCDLNDGSAAGNWRLPTKEELASLVDSEFASPSLANGSGYSQWTDGNIFLKLRSPYFGYWTSSSLDEGNKYYIDFSNGSVKYTPFLSKLSVWPVRDPLPTDPP